MPAMMKEPLHTARKRKGMKIAQLADEFGVSKRTIIRWENGAPRLPVDRLSDAERITGMSRRELRPDIFAEATQ